MNDFQLVGRVKTIAQSQRWQGDPAGGLVWPMGSVLATAKVPTDLIKRHRVPILALTPGSGVADPEFPQLFESQFSATSIVSIPGDKDGEKALMGGMRSSRTTSDGAGLMQMQNELMLALKLLSGREGVNIQSKANTYPDAVFEVETGYIAWREHIFSASTTAEYTEPPVEDLGAAEAAGTVTLTWVPPTFAADGLVEYRVRRTTGNVPVVFPDQGVDVGTVSAGTETIDDVPGAGDFTYSVFAFYDPKGNAVALTYSDCETVTITVP